MNSYIYTDVDGLLDIVHDNYFDLTECVFDRDQHEYRINIGYSARGPFTDKLLLIRNVVEVTVDDRAQIQVQDINEVHVSEFGVLITCGVPIEINIQTEGTPQVYILKHPRSPMDFVS